MASSIVELTFRIGEAERQRPPRSVSASRPAGNEISRANSLYRKITTENDTPFPARHLALFDRRVQSIEQFSSRFTEFGLVFAMGFSSNQSHRIAREFLSA